MRVSVLGAGYVGLVSGVCLAKLGHEVTVLDVSANRIEMLQRGESPIVEPGLTELMKECSGRLNYDMAPASLKDAQFIIIAVGTPSTAYGAADLSYVRSAVDMIAAHASPGALVIMKSTVPPGTGDGLIGSLQAAGCDYASNPEFLREGSALVDFFETDRIVVGARTPSAFAALRELYNGIDTIFLECDIPSAEMIKYASNAFLATKISFINEISSICSRIGADIDAVAQGVGMDHRIGSAFLNAGLGYGGSCFPKDTRALDFLAVANDYDFRLLKAVIEVNARQRMLPVRQLESMLGSLVDKDVAILGITFKPFTDDIREAPALDIAHMLHTRGASVRVHDPEGTLPADITAVQHDDVYDALTGAHAVIIAVDWPDYMELDWARVAAALTEGAVVFDGRNCLDRAQVEGVGLSYVGVGR